MAVVRTHDCGGPGSADGDYADPESSLSCSGRHASHVDSQSERWYCTLHVPSFLVWDGSSWTLGQDLGAGEYMDLEPADGWHLQLPGLGAQRALESAEFDAWRSFGPMTAGSRQR